MIIRRLDENKKTVKEGIFNTYTVNLYGKTYEIWLSRSKYRNNDTLAVMADYIEGPFAVLTVNLDDPLQDEEYAYIDINNCPWAEDFIVDNDLGTFTGEYGYSGWCEYPLYHFNIDKIKSVK